MDVAATQQIISYYKHGDNILIQCLNPQEIYDQVFFERSLSVGFCNLPQ